MITTQDVRAVLDSNEFFRVRFVKRSKKKDAAPEVREMTARLGVKKHLKGGSRPYDAKSNNLLGCWIPEQDRRDGGKDNGYRVIPCENIEWIKARGLFFKQQDGTLVEVKQ